MESKLSRLCEGLLEAGWLVALIAIPLYFNIHSERVFEPDKIALLRSLAVVLLILWAVRFVELRGWQNLPRLAWRDPDSLWRVPFALPVALLLLVYLIASLFSISPRASWLGSYQRLQGTYTMFAYVAVFAVMATTIRSRVQVRRAVTAVIITSIPVAFYGLLQRFGLDPLPWGGDVSARVAGHMGNAIFIAAYLIMVVPLTLARIIDAFSNILGDDNLSYADVLRAAIYIFALATQVLAIYWSGSRGPLIGLAAGLFSFMLVLLVSLRNAAGKGRGLGLRDLLFATLPVLPALIALLLGNRLGQAFSPALAFGLFIGAALLAGLAILLLVAARRGWQWLWLSWLLLVVTVGGWLLLFNIPAARMAEYSSLPLAGDMLQGQLAWKELPVVGSYGRMLDPSQTVGREKSNRVRVLIWQGVIDLISPHAPIAFPDGEPDRYNFLRPLIGYGPESMYVAYNRFYPPELAMVEARNASPDRAHNETFDALVITGVAGFLAWQTLYIAVFYYGFTFLGVVRSRRDRRAFLLAWIGGGLVGALLSLTVVDIIYLGVLIPTGTIAGLVLYLFYYALTARPENQDASTERSPFRTDQLLVNALLAAVLAHYVEVHFGIAISATRLHFFVYTALLFAVVYKLPLKEGLRGVASRVQGQTAAGSAKAVAPPWAGVWPWAFLLGLLTGILGSEFVNYMLPPDTVVQTGADLSAAAIFEQSLFQNAQQGFQDSPFVFLMVVLSWLLGVLVVLSEALRYREERLMLPRLKPLPSVRRQPAAGLLVILGLAGLAARFVGPTAVGARAALGQSLGLLGALLALWAALSLLRDEESGRWTASAAASIGIAFCLPLAVAGSGWVAAGLGAACLLILGLLWDSELRPYVLPPLGLALVALGLGLAYTAMQAVLLREALLYLVFFQEIEPVSMLHRLFFAPDTVVTSIAEARVLEANQSRTFLAAFYMFVFSMQSLAGITLAQPALHKAREWGRTVAYGFAAVTLVAGLLLVYQTNVQPVQADMVYKRARPFDEQASRQGDASVWDTAIAIYEQARDLAPLEDFYTLFLGRAYLERASLAQTAAEQTALLERAEALLHEAAQLNPLNTDHLANLARLNTRWAVATVDPDVQESRLGQAEQYYQQALLSSPQNSVIRNEYARLIFDLRRSCDGAIVQYEQSLAIDPFFASTYFGFADVLTACADAQSDADAALTLQEMAADVLQGGLARDPQQPRAWAQLGQALQATEQYTEALTAFAQLRALSEEAGLPTWNVDYLEATVYRDLGQVAQARALAEQALESAPADAQGQLAAFIEQLGQE